MGGGLLSEEQPLEKTYSEIFDEQFPFYLSIGMSSAEYWTGDPSLARYYRRAYQLRQEQEDYRAWLQGMYFYDALQTALYNSFRKEGKPAGKYPAEPYLQKDKKEKQIPAEDKPDPLVLWMNHLVSNTKNSVHSN